MPSTLSKPERKPQARASPHRERIREATTALEIYTEQGAVPNITATLARGDIINRNGRYYSATVLERAANEARDRVANGEIIGLMDHPDWGEGDKGAPERIVIRWSRLHMNGPDLMGEGTIVNTALGRDLMALKEGGVHIGLSTNAYALAHWENAEDVPAPYDGDKNDLIEVIDELELLTIDVVNDPSNVFAQIHAEATAKRESAERNGNMNEVEKLKAELEAAREALAAAEAKVAEAEAKASEAAEAAAKQERLAVVDVVAAKHPHLAEAIVNAMRTAAENADTVDAARTAVEALAAAVPASTNGNNGVPAAEDTDPAKARFDPMREFKLNN